MSVTEQLRTWMSDPTLPTCYTISKHTGIPQSVLSRFKRDKTDLPGMYVDKLCEFYGAKLVCTDKLLPKNEPRGRKKTCA